MGGAIVMPTFMLHLDDWNKVVMGRLRKFLFTVTVKK